MSIDVSRALETDYVYLRDEMGEQELDYEGTESIQTLLVGRDITGVGAFV
jgi:hypothetical protein